MNTTIFSEPSKNTINVTLSTKHECILLLIDNNEFSVCRINKENKIENISINKIKDKDLKKTVEYYAKIIFDLVKAGRSLNYINDFINKEIFELCY